MVYLEKFDSIYKYMDAINTRPLNRQFKTNASTRIDKSKFSLTETYEEADALFKKGYNDGAKLLTDKMIKIFKNQGYVDKPRQQMGVVGYRVVVPRAIMGHPKAFVRREQTPVKNKVITVNYASTIPAYITAECALETNAKLLSAIKIIEKNDVRVQLNLLMMILFKSEKAKDVATTTLIRVKESAQPLNIQKIAYTVIHPSFLRRHGFRYYETFPFKEKLSDSSTASYGSVVMTDEYATREIKDNLKKNRIDDVIYFDDIRKRSLEEVVSLLTIKYENI